MSTLLKRHPGVELAKKALHWLGLDERVEIFASPVSQIAKICIVVTIPIAEKLLTINKQNRNLSRRNKLFLSGQMATDDWIETGATVKITSEGILIDKQHTLNAIILSGKPQPLWISINVPPKAAAVLDTGKPRSAGDVLYMNDIKDVNTTAAAIKLIIKFINNRAYNRRFLHEKHPITANHKVLEFYENNPDIAEVVKDVTYMVQKTGRKMFTRVGWIAMYWLLSKVHKKKCESFYNDVFYNEYLDRNNAAYVLRNKMEAEYELGRFITPEQIASVITAFNYYKDGLPLTPSKLSYKKGTPFPAITK